MSNPIAHNAKAGIERNLLNGIPDVPEMNPGAGGSDSGGKTALRRLNEIPDQEIRVRKPISQYILYW